MGRNSLTPLVSVVVCTYNRADLLAVCLQTLADQTLNKSLYEVIVVNNNSTDNTQETAEDFARQANFRVVVEMNQGLSHARNRGYKEARGEYVAYIDDDARADERWLENVILSFENVKPEPVAVGGVILPWYEKTPPEWFMDDYEIRSWGTEKGFLQAPRAQDGFSGSNMTFKKSILEEFGGFSADYGVVGDSLRLGEETELFNRIYKKNPLFWYDPDIRVEHLVPARKISVRYRLERAYMGGISGAARNGNYSFIAMLKAVIYITIKSCILPFCVSWWKKDWQRSFLKQAQLIAGSTGFLKGLMSGRK